MSTFKEGNIVLEEMATYKNTNKGVSVVKYEHMDLKLVMEDPSVARDFIKAGCMRFYQKIQRDFCVFFTVLEVNFKSSFWEKKDEF